MAASQTVHFPCLGSWSPRHCPPLQSAEAQSRNGARQGLPSSPRPDLYQSRVGGIAEVLGERPSMYRLWRNFSQATGREGTRKLRLSSEPPADKQPSQKLPDGLRGGLGLKSNPGFPSSKGNDRGRLVSGTVVITMS